MATVRKPMAELQIAYSARLRSIHVSTSYQIGAVGAEHHRALESTQLNLAKFTALALSAPADIRDRWPACDSCMMNHEHSNQYQTPSVIYTSVGWPHTTGDPESGSLTAVCQWSILLHEAPAGPSRFPMNASVPVRHFHFSVLTYDLGSARPCSNMD